MAKSPLVKVNQKITEKVVGTHNAIANAVVGGFTSISDGFVDQFLTKDGESIEEAKQRFAEEREARH